MEQRPKIVRDIVLTCVVLHNMLRAHQGGASRAATPEEDIAALKTEQVVYVPDDHYRNPSMEAKHQRNLTSIILVTGWEGRQDLRCVNQLPWGQKKLTTQLFQVLLYELVLHKSQKKKTFPKSSNRFLTSFQIISNQITTPRILLNNFNPSQVKMSHIKTQI